MNHFHLVAAVSADKKFYITHNYVLPVSPLYNGILWLCRHRAVNYSGAGRAGQMSTVFGRFAYAAAFDRHWLLASENLYSGNSGLQLCASGIHRRGSSRFRHRAGRCLPGYGAAFRSRGNPPSSCVLHYNHLNGGTGDGHPFRAFLLGTALQIYQTDTFIFVNSHKYDFCFRAVQGPKVHDLGRQQTFRSLMGRGIISPHVSGLCNWHMLFTCFIIHVFRKMSIGK